MASHTYRVVLAGTTFLSCQHASMDIRNHCVGVLNHHMGIFNYHVGIRYRHISIDRQLGLEEDS
jgi:hypothetical protein